MEKMHKRAEDDDSEVSSKDTKNRPHKKEYKKLKSKSIKKLIKNPEEKVRTSKTGRVYKEANQAHISCPLCGKKPKSYLKKHLEKVHSKCFEKRTGNNELKTTISNYYTLFKEYFYKNTPFICEGYIVKKCGNIWSKKNKSCKSIFKIS